jgi:hypothetical protein
MPSKRTTTASNRIAAIANKGTPDRTRFSSGPRSVTATLPKECEKQRPQIDPKGWRTLVPIITDRPSRLRAAHYQRCPPIGNLRLHDSIPSPGK